MFSAESKQGWIPIVVANIFAMTRRGVSSHPSAKFFFVRNPKYNKMCECKCMSIVNIHSEIKIKTRLESAL